MTINVISKILFVIAFTVMLISCDEQGKDDLFTGFVNPPAESRPFVRWWWSGSLDGDVIILK